ncbi:MAG: hypothetical protein NTV51_18020 [Verrucomicrobia bacterium]|nr:hypothetical protein [Verrucomicrobiota bacterium]
MRFWPLTTSRTTDTLPAMPAGFGRSVPATIALSGIASISPAPKSGVVTRRATVFASRGTTSLAAGSMARCCSSEPPCDSNGSNTPSTVRPNRVTVRRLAPPVPPAL